MPLLRSRNAPPRPCLKGWAPASTIPPSRRKISVQPRGKSSSGSSMREQVPLSAEERSRLVRDVADDVLGYGPLQRLLDDPGRHGNHGQPDGPDLCRAARQAHVHGVEIQFRGPPAQGHRAHRFQGGPPHRRVVAPRGCPARGRVPRQRRHSPARSGRLIADHPKIQQGAADSPEPHRVRHADARDGRAAECMREGQAQHHRVGRYRHWQDDAAERPVIVPAPSTSAS